MFAMMAFRTTCMWLGGKDVQSESPNLLSRLVACSLHEQTERANDDVKLWRCARKPHFTHIIDPLSHQTAKCIHTVIVAGPSNQQSITSSSSSYSSSPCHLSSLASPSRCPALFSLLKASRQPYAERCPPRACPLHVRARNLHLSCPLRGVQIQCRCSTAQRRALSWRS